ncbi:MAG: hypothetical protein ABF289_16100 [Clostridiales bacterium]
MTKKKIKIKLRYDGGILLYAIFITFIVAVFTGTLVLLFYYLNRNTQNFLIYNQMQDEVKSAIQYSLSSESNLAYDSIQSFKIYDAPFKTSIAKKSWGIFDIIYARSIFQSDSIEIVCLAGSAEKYTNDLALSVTNAQNGLKVSGKTIIEGNIYLPNSSINKVNIEGRSFENIDQQFITVSDRTNMLPSINEKIFHPLNYLQKENIPGLFYSLNYITSNDSIVNSFMKSPVIIYHSGNIRIENKTLIGNIIIISDNDVYIDNSCNIENIIVIANKIHITELKESQLQCFAGQSIILNSVALRYPSALVVKDSYNNPESNLIVSGSSNICGTLIHITKPSVKSKIIVSKESQVEGIIYSTSFVELNNNLYGSLICYGLYVQTRQNNYENLIIDNEINVYKRSKYYIEPNIFSSNNDKKIIQWLN